MARYQNIVFVTLLCVYELFIVESKIFSKSVGDISIFQQPEVNTYTRGQTLRTRRSAESENTNYTLSGNSFHSQNLTLNTTTFSLHGVDDNEVFVHWTGENNDTVFVLTRSHKHAAVQSCALWRSTDYGETYKKADLPDNLTINHMHSSPVSRLKIVLSDLTNKQLYITMDTGATWRTVGLDFLPYRLLLHPTDSNLILAYSLQEMKLRMSKDFGITWTVLKERVTERFFWGIPDVDPDHKTVHMELQDPIGPVSYHCCIAPNCDPVSYDKSVGTIDFYSLVVENDYIFVQKSVDDNTSLYVSYKRGPFKKALFPLKLHPLDFNIVDSSQNQVLIAVDHEEDIACLFVSDITGQFFIISVENIVGMRYPGKFDVDLVKVNGFKGVYIINKFPNSRNNAAAFKQTTMITFNNGGTWKPLPAPNETKHLCENKDDCNLHLHIGNTNQFFRIPLAVTSQYAPGLILAHGSVGPHLDLDIHVFISRDAGLTWSPAPFYGNHFLNIMDQGSLISAVSAEGAPTNQVHFSTSEGQDWSSHNFSDALMTVDGVVNEPGKKTLITSLFGHKNNTDGWVMVKMDFNSVFGRKCETVDIEIWNPASDLNDSGNKCIMGESFTLERKKQFSHCYYGEDHVKKLKIQPCNCGREDFECDFGYEVSANSGQCVRSKWFNSNLLPALECSNGKYNRSSGYRKVAASGCTGGEEAKYKPVEADCPLIAPGGLHIVSEKSFITRGDNVTFILSQESGSEEQTMYTWLFGDGAHPITIQGLQKASIMTRSFTSVGTYNITVAAVNNNGKSSTLLQIHVEDELKGVLVEIPWGARTGSPSYFNVTVLGSDNFTKYGEKSKLFFAWHFENKVTGSIRQLTWLNVIKQQFQEPGEYILKLEVFNSVSSIFYTQQVDVYDDITTVRLHFSSHIDRYNSSSLNVRQALAEILCHNLAQILEVRRTRIIMTVQPSFPIVADLTVLPAKTESNESETFKVVQMLIEEAKHQYLAFPLFTNDDIVIITDAGILNLDSGEESPTVPPPVIPVTMTVTVPVNVTMVHEKHNMLAVYISVPVILAVIVIAGIIIVYYRKKLRKDTKYYPIVKHRHRVHHDSTCSCGDGDDEFTLGLEDPEFTIIPDSEFTDASSTLMILNEPISDRDRVTDIC